MSRELLNKHDKARVLATNIRRDLSRLQIAILKRNEHDIGVHLAAALERSDELDRVMSDASLATVQ